MIEIRRMAPAELEGIRSIDRSETIRVRYRQRGADLIAEDVHWNVPPWRSGTGEHSVSRIIDAASEILAKGGTAFGAFQDQILVGIAVYGPNLGPKTAQLSLLHVSSGHRRHGVASRLFEKTRQLALQEGAARMYVSATPSESAVTFYLQKGFFATSTPDPVLLAEEPEDIHMILHLEEGQATGTNGEEAMP